MSKRPQKKILIVEDEPKILEGIVDALSFKGFLVVTAQRGDEAISKALIEKPDLIILDIMIPKLSGLDVCENLRESGVKAPIIFLTAKGSEEDRIVGLERGGDDYITKPFSIKELVARVQAHLRRREIDALEAISSESGKHVFEIKGLTVDFQSRSCWANGEKIHLSEKEFRILKVLFENIGQVVDRETLLKQVWGYRTLDLETRTVDVTIGKLRQKIEIDIHEPKIIKTKRGKGYIIEGTI
ncbi:MAG: DNA-binding response regulator [Acidobacteria bacterium]|nr:MAG: DNA-binding response regulator [Acidobacteriota bacterium]PIE90956.1 MAG: DNA-binding response regulator [Acidobacteriota bacterium]